MSTETKTHDRPPQGVWQPNDAQRAILTDLLEASQQEKTVVDFARKYLPFGRSLFDQMMDAIDPKRVNAQGERLPSYFDKISAEAVDQRFAELENIRDEIPRKRIQYSRIKESTILVTSKIRAVETAVRECAGKPGPERIVLCLAPTGAGKTMTSNHLATKFSAKLVEVRSGWRRSETGFVPLMDICRALDVRVSPGNSVSQMEDDLVKFCAERNVVLCFDEGEHFGRAALNLVKFLLNKTRIVVVIFIVPDEYAKWFNKNRFPNEGDQIARRIHAVVETSVLDEKDVALFFPKDQFADEPAMLKLLAREASRFGHFSLIKRVATKLENITKAEESDMLKAIERTRKEMKRI